MISFAEEQSGTNAQLGFVAFRDGDEAAGKAQFGDEAAFAQTIHRPGCSEVTNRALADRSKKTFFVYPTGDGARSNGRIGTSILFSIPAWFK